ncbi:MAG: DNA internalization-related competence protein ComEC/Rec2 [Gemmatales bacterium]|nr:DNA internalization-related competence protein ComEC/Rec2 [Gemmatales bacterium]MDW8387405.1 DNA internalization-related competence protein ComEC/Rec2 [Gemmatales bacterium]
MESAVAPSPDKEKDRHGLLERLGPRGPAPLLPWTVAVLGGIVADRFFQPGRPILGLISLLAIAAFILTALRGKDALLPWAFLGLAAVFGAWWHDWRQHPGPDNLLDAPLDQPRLARLRGTVLEVRRRPARQDVLLSLPLPEQTRLLLEVSAWQTADAWTGMTGRCQVYVTGRVVVNVGDQIEVMGELQRFAPAANPGEADLADSFRDRGVGAMLRVKTPNVVRVLEPGHKTTVSEIVARIRDWSDQQLGKVLPPEEQALAKALLLGDTSALDAEELASFRRVGVSHILAISGQHLAVVCGLLWPLLRLLPTRRSSRAVILIVAAWCYALITGSRPPILRAAIMVTAFCGAILLGRKVQSVNSLAAAALIVLAVNPAEAFQVGTQISFLAVLVLLTLAAPLDAHLFSDKETTVESLLRRSYFSQALLRLGRWSGSAFLATFVVWLALMPLLASRFHLVSPAALVIGPLLLLLVCVVLASGFSYLLAVLVGDTLAWPMAQVLHGSLWASRSLVHVVEDLPGAYWHVVGPPVWLLAAFYGGLTIALLWPMPGFMRKWGLILCGICLALWAALPTRWPVRDEVRCTVLSVGHGSCAVLELPCGRVLMCDAGSLRGPETAERQIAPFLWSRGITRIDEVLLSHADLDHFNGVPGLLDRFSVGMITVTPTFFAREEPAVDTIMARLEQQRLPSRIVQAGQLLKAGETEIEVLHPPASGPQGPENARSMVLLVRYRGRSLLLTGDLEQEGLERVLSMAPRRVEVLIAPHHGSPSANTERLAEWANPRLVVVSDGQERGHRPDPYSPRGAVVWRTSREGAVTVRLTSRGIQAETFATKKRWQLMDGP